MSGVDQSRTEAVAIVRASDDHIEMFTKVDENGNFDSSGKILKDSKNRRE